MTVVEPGKGPRCFAIFPGWDCVLTSDVGLAGVSRRPVSTSRGILLSAVGVKADGSGDGLLGMFSIASASDLSIGLTLGRLVGVGDPSSNLLGSEAAVGVLVSSSLVVVEVSG